jgi:hypothetical protein
MCNEKVLTDDVEIPALFMDDLEILEDRLTDIILAIGLPEEQTSAVLRLITDALEEHHNNILDTFEYSITGEDDQDPECAI